MNKKTIIFIILILIIILGAVFGVYFYIKNGIEKKDQGSAATTENKKSDDGTNKKIETDDFSIDLPQGWSKNQQALGASAMAVNVNEEIIDPAIKKINFKTYYAVSYDQKKGKNLVEYMQKVKDDLKQAAPDVVFANENEITINGNAGRALEAELNQQGVDFKVLIVIISGKGDDVWAISFSTAKSNWEKYQETFSNIANSFALKK